MRPGGTKPGFPQHFHSQLLILWKDPFFPNRWFTRALLEFLNLVKMGLTSIFHQFHHDS